MTYEIWIYDLAEPDTARPFRIPYPSKRVPREERVEVPEGKGMEETEAECIIRCREQERRLFEEFGI